MTKLEILRTACMAVLSADNIYPAAKLPVLSYLIPLKNEAEQLEKAELAVEAELNKINEANGNG